MFLLPPLADKGQSWSVSSQSFSNHINHSKISFLALSNAAQQQNPNKKRNEELIVVKKKRTCGFKDETIVYFFKTGSRDEASGLGAPVSHSVIKPGSVVLWRLKLLPPFLWHSNICSDSNNGRLLTVSTVQNKRRRTSHTDDIAPTAPLIWANNGMRTVDSS